MKKKMAVALESARGIPTSPLLRKGHPHRITRNEKTDSSNQCRLNPGGHAVARDVNNFQDSNDLKE
jgi:hypothetical protein